MNSFLGLLFCLFVATTYNYGSDPMTCFTLDVAFRGFMEPYCVYAPTLGIPKRHMRQPISDAPSLLYYSATHSIYEDSLEEPVFMYYWTPFIVIVSSFGFYASFLIWSQFTKETEDIFNGRL